jgi:hypothetical protein
MRDEIEIDDLVTGLRELTLPSEGFRHREHLRFAHYRLLHDGYPFAIETVSDAIMRFARRHGHGQKFHATLTQCWVRLLAAALDAEPGGMTFETLTERRPELLDKALPLRYYTRERLFSDAARAGWREPDLCDLPRCSIHRGAAA